MHWVLHLPAAVIVCVYVCVAMCVQLYIEKPETTSSAAAAALMTESNDVSCSTATWLSHHHHHHHYSLIILYSKSSLPWHVCTFITQCTHDAFLPITRSLHSALLMPSCQSHVHYTVHSWRLPANHTDISPRNYISVITLQYEYVKVIQMILGVEMVTCLICLPQLSATQWYWGRLC